MRISRLSVLLFFASVLLTVSCSREGTYQMKGVVLEVNDLETVDWPKLAHESGINTLGTHKLPDEVLTFIQSEKGQRFLEGCKKYGIQVEHQLHAMSTLLPRDLFQTDSTLFRMNEQGRRVADWNCCVHSEKALNTIADRALYFAQRIQPTNHRYYFWLDDGGAICQCPQCKPYSASDQALMIENKILEKLRSWDKKAMVAHLAYDRTLAAPTKVRPSEGIFLEFAPFYRSWEKPIADRSVEARGMTHGHNLDCLEENLKVFNKETAEVLEYWLDVSLCSGWKKPAKQLPWHKDVYLKDLETYRSYGIRHFTTFAVYMDKDYFTRFPDKTFLKEYGKEEK